MQSAIHGTALRTLGRGRFLFPWHITIPIKSSTYIAENKGRAGGHRKDKLYINFDCLETLIKSEKRQQSALRVFPTVKADGDFIHFPSAETTEEP